MKLTTENSAYYRFNDTTMALTLFALRDLAPGEEVTISYLYAALEAPRSVRQEQLKQHWNFDCQCSVCSASAEEVALSDDRRERIGHANEKLARPDANARYLYRAATQLAQLYDEEGLITPRARTNEIAAFASSMIGDENEAIRFANAAKRYWRILAGKDSFEVRRMDELRRDPTTHPSWKVDLPKVPEGEMPKLEDFDPPMFTIED
jgi:hypothetical protein